MSQSKSKKTGQDDNVEPQSSGDIVYRGRKPDNQRIQGLQSDVPWDQVDHATRVNYMHNYLLKRWQKEQNESNGNGFDLNVT